MKKSQNSRNKGFSCFVMERPGSGTGSVSLTSGSGSGRLKNIRIRDTNKNLVYKSSCYPIAAFSRGKKFGIKISERGSPRAPRRDEWKGTHLELPGGMSERGLTSSSQEGWVKGDSPRAPRRDGWKESSIPPSGTRPSLQTGSSPNQPGNPSGPLLNNKQFHII